MARIPTADIPTQFDLSENSAKGNVLNPAPAPLADRQEISAATMGSRQLAETGKDLGTAAIKFSALADKEDEEKINGISATLYGEQERDMLERAKNMPPDGGNFSGDIRQDYDNRAREKFAAAQAEGWGHKSLKRLDDKLNGHGEALQTQAMRFQLNRSENYQSNIVALQAMEFSKNEQRTLMDAVRDMPEGGRGFTDQYTKDVDLRIDEAVKKAEAEHGLTPDQSQKLRVALAKHREISITHAYGKELEARDVDEMSKIGTFTGSKYDQVMQDPSSLAQVRQEGVDFIRRSALPERAKAKAEKDFVSKITQQAFDLQVIRPGQSLEDRRNNSLGLSGGAMGVRDIKQPRKSNNLPTADGVPDTAQPDETGPGMPPGTTSALGMATPGNLDLTNRPVVPMKDGKIATVRSMSIPGKAGDVVEGTEGKQVLIPTVSPDGKILTEKQAITQYEKTGKHLGIFDTPENATAYAKRLHEEQDKQYSPSPEGKRPIKSPLGGAFPVQGIASLDDIPHDGGSQGSRDWLGKRGGGKHAGLDIPGKVGTPVTAVGEGVVVRVGDDVKGYGNYVDIRYSDGTVHRSAHLDSVVSGLKEGDTVEAGSNIGRLGYTGNATKDFPHVHYEVFPDADSYQQGNKLANSRMGAQLRMDPRAYFSQSGEAPAQVAAAGPARVAQAGTKGVATDAPSIPAQPAAAAPGAPAAAPSSDVVQAARAAGFKFSSDRVDTVVMTAANGGTTEIPVWQHPAFKAQFTNPNPDASDPEQYVDAHGLTPSKRIALIKKNQAQYEAEAGSVLKDIQSQKKVLTDGDPPNEAMLKTINDKVQLLGSDTVTAEWHAALRLHDEAARMRVMNPEDAQVAVNTRRREYEQAGWTEARKAEIDHLQGIATKFKEMAKENPAQLAHKTGRIDFSYQLDFNNDDVMQQHATNVRKNAEFLHQEPKYLDDNQVASAMAIVKSGNTEKTQKMLSSMIRNFGVNGAESAIKQFAPHDPEFAWAGLLAVDGEKSGGRSTAGKTSSAIIEAINAQNNPEYAKTVGRFKPKEADRQSAIGDMFKTAFQADNTTRAAVENVTDKLYAFRAQAMNLDPSDTINAKLYQQTARDVLGETDVNGVKFGGVYNTGFFSRNNPFGGDYQRHSIAVPSRMDQTTPTRVLGVVKDQDIEDAEWNHLYKSYKGGAGPRGDTYYDMRGPINLPRDKDGNRLSMEDMRHYALVSSGDGKYWLAQGKDDMGRPAKFAKNAAGGNFELDLNKLEDTFIKKRMPEALISGAPPTVERPDPATIEQLRRFQKGAPEEAQAHRNRFERLYGRQALDEALRPDYLPRNDDRYPWSFNPGRHL